MDIFIVKGVSGSGKSTRTFMLIKFFIEVLELEYEDYYFFNSVKEKELKVGILFPKINCLFIGKFYKTGSVERFQGYDSVTSAFVNSQGFSDFLKNTVDKYDIVIEGAGVTMTHRLRPQFLYEYVKPCKVLVQFYSYEDNEQGLQKYLQRLFYRSGVMRTKEEPGTMWGKNSSYHSEYRTALKEADQNEGSYVFQDFQDASLSDFGVKFFTIKNSPEEIIYRFIEFCNSSDYINKNSHKQFQK